MIIRLINKYCSNEKLSHEELKQLSDHIKYIKKDINAEYNEKVNLQDESKFTDEKINTIK